MWTLLNTTDRNHYRVITYLNSDDRPQASIAELSKQCGCSEKTIYNYLDQIAQEWEPELKIQNLHGRYYVDQYNQKLNDKILRTFLLRATSISLFVDIFLHPNTSNELRMEQFFISESTFYRSLRAINASFKSNGIQIQRNGFAPVSIVSDQEHYIRKFVTCMVLELYGSEHLDSILKMNTEACTAMIQHIFQARGIYYDRLTLVFSVTLFAVSELRERQGYHSNLCLMEKTSIQDACFEPIFKDYREFDAHICIQSLSEVMYYHTPVLNPSIIEPYTQKILNHVMEATQKNLSPSTQAFITTTHQTLLNNYMLYPFKTSLFIDRIAEFMNGLDKERPWLKSHFLGAIESVEPVVQLDPKLYLNDLLYWTIMNCPEMLELIPRKISILFFSDLGEHHARYLQSDLFGRFQLNTTDFIVTCCSACEIQHDAYDIIVGNAVRSEYPQIILVDDYPTQNQYVMILEALYTCHQTLNMHENHNLQPK
ncbi:HTH domain-containing protein [Erysipelothrix piscisicarius]|uniref:HTH domain-containing protein n=1 Tax=Erysipelothrix piscisicarius TaxID=2485784 RepID=A0A3Q8S6L5_9FIRM|nr:helix-turn-helix domain-containing protein [Erysipelothrix piscisicarius]AZK43510.1 HTH domain-containing protein [Erysipelothrix piscisicarius]